jgi:hypothetical protein
LLQRHIGKLVKNFNVCKGFGWFWTLDLAKVLQAFLFFNVEFLLKSPTIPLFVLRSFVVFFLLWSGLVCLVLGKVVWGRDVSFDCNSKGS